jgi:methylated-DNA-[protein]-cysteine S-methyltransferase
MQKSAKYVIFKTKLGYFGLAGTESALCRTCLPERTSASIRRRLLEDLPDAEFDENFFKDLQEQTTSYFEGSRVDFRHVAITLNGFSVFSQKILKACRKVGLGQTITYSELAKRADRPNASRAVGGVMARNPMPLIIPCHRIIRADGKMGGFTAPGGISLKKKMLELEQQGLVLGKMSNDV